MKNYNTNQAGEPERIIPRNGAADKSADLLNQLLDRGDKVSIESGKLVLIPASGNPVPGDWFDDNEAELVEQIAVQAGVVILRYVDYSTGAYSSRFYEGVTLQFDDVATQADAYAIFNCMLIRARTTTHGDAKRPLPKKHFRLGKKHQLTKLLKLAGIEPRRLSDAYKSLHKLKVLLLSATYVLNKGDRLQSDSITPLNLTHQQLIELLKITRQQRDNSATTPRQHRDNSATKYRDKKMADSHTQSHSQQSATTGAFNHGKRTTLQGDTVTRVTPTPSLDTPLSTPLDTPEGKGKSGLTPEAEEWAADYGDLTNQ